MPRRSPLPFCLVLAALAAAPALPWPAASAAAPPAETAAPSATTAIDGFRDAHFGMTEAELRGAIRKDFPKAAIAAAINPAEKTTVLSLTASGLLPETGPARISYILGYQSKRLIQVNILWVSSGTGASDAAVVASANTLRDYFAARKFAPQSIVRNQQLEGGAILVFRGSDDEGRMVVLVLSGSTAAAQHVKKPPEPLTLELSYIADGAHPDIFRIKKGQF